MDDYRIPLTDIREQDRVSIVDNDATTWKVANHDVEAEVVFTVRKLDQ